MPERERERASATERECESSYATERKPLLNPASVFTALSVDARGERQTELTYSARVCERVRLVKSGLAGPANPTGNNHAHPTLSMHHKVSKETNTKCCFCLFCSRFCLFTSLLVLYGKCFFCCCVLVWGVCCLFCFFASTSLQHLS